jgi:hypothetical protein
MKLKLFVFAMSLLSVTKLFAINEIDIIENTLGPKTEAIIEKLQGKLFKGTSSEGGDCYFSAGSYVDEGSKEYRIGAHQKISVILSKKDIKGFGFNEESQNYRDSVEQIQKLYNPGNNSIFPFVEANAGTCGNCGSAGSPASATNNTLKFHNRNHYDETIVKIKLSKDDQLLKASARVKHLLKKFTCSEFEELQYELVLLGNFS